MINIIVNALIYIFPAYVANSSAVLFGGGKPIDLGKKVGGKRILGDGKTFRGFIFGALFGSLTGLGINIIKPGYFPVFLGLSLSIGGLIGDIIASFLKRRVGVKRGRPVPILDQIDFVIGAVMLGSLVEPPSGKALIFILLATPLIHLTANFLGYLLNFKENPW